MVKTLEEVRARGRAHAGHDAGDPADRAPGQEVNRLYIEEGGEIARELYLSCLVDRATSRVAFIASTEGGMDIEKVAHETPEKIVTVAVDPAVGYCPYVGRRLAAH